MLARDALLVALLLALVWPARLARAGVAVVAAVVAVALAAVGAAAAASGSSASTHVGLLTGTGVASSCGASKPTPPVTSGVVRFEQRAYANRSGRPACVAVVVRPASGAQVFSVAYGGALDPGDPRARYLGDPGICSNAAPGLPQRLRYSFVVPARTPFSVEVEPCSTVELPPYTIRVRLRPFSP